MYINIYTHHCPVEVCDDVSDCCFLHSSHNIAAVVVLADLFSVVLATLNMHSNFPFFSASNGFSPIGGSLVFMLVFPL